MKKLLLAAFAALMLSCVMAAQTPVQIGTSTYYSGTLTATCSNANSPCDTTAGSQIKFGTTNYGNATIGVSGSYTGFTPSFEFSLDGGSVWYQSTCSRTDVASQDTQPSVTNNATRAWDCGVAASAFFRVRSTALSTGSVTVQIIVNPAEIEPAPTVALHGQTTGIVQDVSGFLGTYISPGGSSLAAFTPRFFNSAVTTAVQVNSVATNIFGWAFYNPNASVCYVQMFGLPSASVTLGTTTPLMVIPLAASSPNVIVALPHIRGASGWTIAATTTPTGSTTCATGVVATIF